MIRMRPSKPTVLRRLAPMPVVALALILPLVLPVADARADDEPDHDETGSFYMEYMVGVSHSPEGTIRGDNSASIGLFGSTEQAPVGYFVGGGLGGYVMDNVRVEVQIGFRETEIDNMQVQGEPDAAKNSTLSLFSVMYNAYYDFDLRDRDVPIVPWLGLGIGWGMPRIDGENQAGPNQLSIDDTASTMVYNFMGGATWPFSDQAELVLGYRYLASIEFDVRGTQSGLSQRFEYEYGAHEAYTGMRFRF